MSEQRLGPALKMAGQPRIPGDKSVSHRGLIFGGLATGLSRVDNLLESEDVQSTARCLRQMGVKISKQGETTLVEGIGKLISPTAVLDCGNSGTTMRLLMGVLASQDGLQAELSGDSSLIRRPMKRVAAPLRQMGAQIDLHNDEFAPLQITGRKLHGREIELHIASAQIKTAVILAGIFAAGTTRIHGEIHSRDHTERLLSHFGVRIESSASEIQVLGGQRFQAANLQVPGDPSTAAFWLAAASLVKGSHLQFANVSLNPTRTGFIRILEKMGARLKTTITTHQPEPMGSIEVEFAELKGVSVAASEIPALIDELPMLAVLASQAHGVTEVVGAEELRVKETDRIEAVAHNLRAMGGRIETRPDGFRIEGPQALHGATIESFHDHRIAMAFSIASLIASGETVVRDSHCVGISYPEFYQTLSELSR